MLISTHFISCSSVFSGFIVDFEQVKFPLVVRSNTPENHDIALFLFVRHFRFIVVRGELRTCDTSKIELTVVYSLKSLRI